MKTKFVFLFVFTFLYLPVLATSQIIRDTINADKIPVATKTDTLEWNFINNNLLGIRGETTKNVGTENNLAWTPYSKAKKYLRGKVMKFNYYVNVVPRDMDWNIFIKPDTVFRFLIDEPVSKSDNIRFWNEESENENYVESMEAEVEPTHDFKANYYIKNDFQSSFKEMASIPAITDLIGKDVCVYGPWVSDGRHFDKPEIHPFELIWWHEVQKKENGDSINEFVMSSIMDASDRFKDTKGTSWQSTPFKVSFRYAFKIMANAGRTDFTIDVDKNHVTFEENQRTNFRNLHGYIKRNDSIIAAINMPYFPSYIKASFTHVKKMPNGDVIGYLLLKYEFIEPEGYADFRLKVTTRSVEPLDTSYVSMKSQTMIQHIQNDEIFPFSYSNLRFVKDSDETDITIDMMCKKIGNEMKYPIIEQIFGTGSNTRKLSFIESDQFVYIKGISLLRDTSLAMCQFDKKQHLLAIPQLTLRTNVKAISKQVENLPLANSLFKFEESSYCEFVKNPDLYKYITLNKEKVFSIEFIYETLISNNPIQQFWWLDRNAAFSNLNRSKPFFHNQNINNQFNIRFEYELRNLMSGEVKTIKDHKLEFFDSELLFTKSNSAQLRLEFAPRMAQGLYEINIKAISVDKNGFKDTVQFRSYNFSFLPGTPVEKLEFLIFSYLCCQNNIGNSDQLFRLAKADLNKLRIYEEYDPTYVKVRSLLNYIEQLYDLNEETLLDLDNFSKIKLKY